MRLLRILDNGDINPPEEFLKDIPPYAILSHTWGDDEVTFQDLFNKKVAKKKLGYKKIEFCGFQARRDDLQYFWVDTCCIDKTKSTELSEAVNSMFNWYQDAAVCYAYLSDVNEDSDLDESRWFTRGWTLQELVAPKEMEFFNKHRKKIDTRSNLSPAISRITGIPRRILLLDFSGEYSAAQIISWAVGRETTKKEDVAYCLLGLLGVNMPLIYGEGARAFLRLQQEFIKTSNDHSLFSWRGLGPERGVLAQSPAEFEHCRYFTAGTGNSSEFSMTNRGLRIDLPLIANEDGTFAAVLDCLGPEGNRRAIYLKKVHDHDDIYRRDRSAEDLRMIDSGEAIPAPQTVYIESGITQSLGRGRLIQKNYGYKVQVDFGSALRHGFSLRQHYSPDDWRQWDSSNKNKGFLTLNLDASGQYGGLLFHKEDTGEQFVAVFGVHNYKGWSDITNIGTNENFEEVVDQYYHYVKPHDSGNPGCRCSAQWKNFGCVENRVAPTMSVITSIHQKGSTLHFEAGIEVKAASC